MKLTIAIVLVLLLLAGGIAVDWFVYHDNPNPPWPFRETYTTEHTDYRPPPPPADDVLTDDTLEGKNPGFDPTRIDRRPLGAKGEWLINHSAAVMRLDVPIIKPDIEPQLLPLHASYKAAIDSYPIKEAILPSVNLLDGKAKQFDDGLYAALDQAYYKGLEGKLLGHVEMVRRIHEKKGRQGQPGRAVSGRRVGAGRRQGGCWRPVHQRPVAC